MDLKEKQKLSSLSATGSVSFSGWSTHASLLLVILFWIKLNEDPYLPGLRQAIHGLNWPAHVRHCSYTMIPLCQHCLIRMQEGDAPINGGKCCMKRQISERETKHSSSKWGLGEVRLQSSASVVASLLFPSAGSLANTRGDSQLGACVPLTPCLFFITGLAGERLPTWSLSQILLELQLSHGGFIPNILAAVLPSVVRNCSHFLFS